MENTNVNNEKASRKDMARRRMEYYPLPLRWFKFFRYVSMILNIILGVFSVINIISVIVAMANPEIMTAVQQNFPDAAGMLIPSIIAEMIMTVYILVLCVLVFIKMGELTTSAYKLIVTFLISFTVIKGIDEYMNCMLNLAMYPDVQRNVIGSVIFTVALSGAVSLLNYIYFRKRKSLFTDNLEVEDYVVDDGSVQLEHYDECPFCHAKINGNSSFCEHCGRNFTEPTNYSGEDNSRKE